MELYFKIKTVLTIIGCLGSLGVVLYLLFSCIENRRRIERVKKAERRGDNNAKQ